MMADSFIFRGTDQRPSCHCASITDLPGGGLLATWYAGTREGAADVAVMSAVHDGSAWSEPEVLFDPPGRPGGNTVVYHHASHLWHWIDVIEGEGWDSAMLYLMRSDDGGESWTDPEVFDDEPGMMVRHRPLRLSDGAIALPAYDEKSWEGFAYLSDDDGNSWHRSGMMRAPSGCIQPAIIERDDGDLFALMRSDRNARHAWESVSTDGGRTWGHCEPSQLLNPNSGADMIRLRSSETIVCFNDTPQGRTPMTLALSADEGRSWCASRAVESEPGEYSYPTLMEDPGGSVHLVYTWRRERIRWINFEAEWIAQAGS